MSKQQRAKWGSPEWRKQRVRAGERGGEVTKARMLEKNPNYYKDIARKSVEARRAKHTGEGTTVQGDN